MIFSHSNVPCPSTKLTYKHVPKVKICDGTSKGCCLCILEIANINRNCVSYFLFPPLKSHSMIEVTNEALTDEVTLLLVLLESFGTSTNNNITFSLSQCSRFFSLQHLSVGYIGRLYRHLQLRTRRT